MDKVNDLIKEIYDFIGEPVDYAELVSSPVPSSYGCYYVYEDPAHILLNEAAEMLQAQQDKINELLNRFVRAKWHEICDIHYDDYGDRKIFVVEYFCSNCKCHSDYQSDYCHNCGAKMDLEE